MSEGKVTRLNKILRELNISLERAVEFLASKGHEIEASPNTKISAEVSQLLSNEFDSDKSKKEASKEIVEDKRKEREAIRIEQEKENEEKRKAQEQEVIKAKGILPGIKSVGKIDLNRKKDEAKAEKQPEAPAQTAQQEIEQKPQPIEEQQKS
ncbi:hypothetical protein QIU19_05610 [Capnocytophaga canimorsus]|nr:hypothetical protein [Capnocytophaga canimorsus]WGU69229.1 hypothetical protein QIU19_05610 [Capnocytophaga canimorsus]